MNEITEFTYMGLRLKYNPETGECWRAFISGWKLLRPGNHGQYIRLYVDGKSVLLHRLLAEVFLNAGVKIPEKLVVDHKIPADGTHQQDRLSNLRICEQFQNLANQGARKSGAQRYKGVSLEKRTGRYRATFMHRGRIYQAGYYSTPEAAALAYDKLASKVIGEFANLNFN